MTSIATNVHAVADELSLRLRDFHCALIHSAAGDDPALKNPYTFLFAVINDPRFAWTAKLSRLIVRLDEAAKEGEIRSGADLAAYGREVAQLIGDGKDADADFRLHYRMALQVNPEVAIAAGALRRVMAKLPPVGADA